MRGILVCAFVGVAAVTAFAELDVKETAWMRQAMDALGSPSERVRTGGADAIVRLGIDSAAPLAAECGRLKTDAAWSALEAAFVRIGAADAAQALDWCRDRWPKGQEKRLGELVAKLRAPAAGPAPAAPPGAPAAPSPDIDAKVRALLEPLRTARVYSSEEPAVMRVIALGRSAVPTLLAMFREARSDRHEGMLMMGLTDALVALVREGDLPELVQLLEDGHLEVAKAIARVRTPSALDALIASIDRGFVSHEFMEALAFHGSDPRVTQALLRWLGRDGAGGGYSLGIVAEFLADRQVAAAAAPLAELLPGVQDLSVERYVGAALARLGRKEGIAALVHVMENAVTDRHDYDRHAAGEALNRIVGRRVYAGAYGGPGERVDDNADAATKEFRRWWDSVKDKIRFDETRKAWRTE